MDTSPDGIRVLRGDLSVAEFAHQVGVTPLTIYRWELSEDAPESRRPRRGSRERLRALMERALATTSAPAPAPALVEALDTDLSLGRWEQARERAIAAMTAGAEPALPQIAFAAGALLGRGDGRAALAALTPTLREVREGRAHPQVTARACALVALVRAAPDGRTYDPSRVREAAAQAVEHAIDAPDYAALAAVAELQAAWFGADASVFEWTFSRRSAVLDGARSPTIAALVLEMRAARAYLEGRPGDAARRYSLVIEQARELGFGLLEARALCMRALLDLAGATPPARVLALTRRARQARTAARLEPGHVDQLIAAVEAEALMRRGLAGEASAVCREADAVGEEIRWLPVETLLCRTRMTFDVDGYEGVKRLLEWFEARSDWQPAPEAPLCFLRALDASFRSEVDEALAEMRAAADRCDRTRPWLERMARVLVLAYTVYARPEQAEAAESSMERYMERSPSAWSRGIAGYLKGMLATQLGDYALASEQLQTGIATLEMAGDVYETARCRRALAISAWIRGAPNAAALLEETDQEFERLGIVASPGQRPENVQRLGRPAAGSVDRPPLPLIVPVQRLAVRGLSTAQLRRELLTMAHDLADATVSLVERGPPEVLLAKLGEDTAPEVFSLEFADGMGRRYRLGVAGSPDGETRSLLRALTAVGGMALERAALYESPPEEERRQDTAAPEGFIAASPAARALLDDLRQLGRSQATVLLTGESGSGKEVAASALHALSSRSSGPFIAFNCASVPRNLFDAQLFGYRKGAFTGARDSRPGMIRAADGGTLFLDEVGELPLEVQAKLLRFLENREVQPLGADRPLKVDVRVVAATHRDLRAMVSAREFREDLLYRLRVIPLHLPPLRERREDILPLARHFLTQLTGGAVRLAPDAIAALSAHHWPGNVRELRNVLERTTAFVPAGVLTAAALRFDRH